MVWRYMGRLHLKKWLVSLIRKIMQGNKDYEGLLQGAYIVA